jgi:hypothetical protein
MKRLSSLVAVSVLTVACGTQQPAAPAAPAAPTATPHANLAQLMRGIPFPASNIIFDAQSTDPGAKPAESGGAGAGATSQYSSVYGGWQAVENSALAISETANLLLIPGRKCENGKDVPLQNEDFQKWAQNLAAAGQAAYKAAQAKNLDQIVEVSGTVSDACAMCHEKYRDKENNADRCS